MNRSFIRRIVFALVAAQLLCAPPAAQALAALGSAGPGQESCAELMFAADENPADKAGCPCCPDDSLVVCLSSCTATAGATSSFDVPVVRVGASPVPSAPLIHRAALADPPLKPPPIG